MISIVLTVAKVFILRVLGYAALSRRLDAVRWTGADEGSRRVLALNDALHRVQVELPVVGVVARLVLDAVPYGNTTTRGNRNGNTAIDRREQLMVATLSETSFSLTS